MSDLGSYLPTAAPTDERPLYAPPSHMRDIGYCPPADLRSPWGRSGAARHLGVPEWHRARNQQIEQMLGQQPDALPNQRRVPQKYSMFE